MGVTEQSYCRHRLSGNLYTGTIPLVTVEFVHHLKAGEFFCVELSIIAAAGRELAQCRSGKFPWCFLLVSRSKMEEFQRCQLPYRAERYTRILRHQVYRTRGILSDDVIIVYLHNF